MKNNTRLTLPIHTAKANYRTHRRSLKLALVPVDMYLGANFMAIARCQQCGNLNETKQRYPHPHSPQPEQGIMCGSPRCARPALVWLNDAEEHQYRHTALRTFTVVRHRGVEVE